MSNFKQLVDDSWGGAEGGNQIRSKAGMLQQADSFSVRCWIKSNQLRKFQVLTDLSSSALTPHVWTRMHRLCSCTRTQSYLAEVKQAEGIQLKRTVFHKAHAGDAVLSWLRIRCPTPGMWQDPLRDESPPASVSVSCSFTTLLLRSGFICSVHVFFYQRKKKKKFGNAKRHSLLGTELHKEEGGEEMFPQESVESKKQDERREKVTSKPYKVHFNYFLAKIKKS